MTLFKTIANIFGMTAPEPSLRDTKNSPQSVANTTPGLPIRSPEYEPLRNRYAPIMNAIERGLAAFMMEQVTPHREIESADFFKLVHVRIQALDADSAALLSRFIDEFREGSRRNIVLKAVERHCAHGVVTDQLLSLQRGTGEETGMDEPIDAWQENLGDAPSEGYRLTLLGEWVANQHAKERATARHSAVAGTTQDISSNPVQITLVDAEGTRCLQVTALPVRLGRDEREGWQRVAGKFVSRRHGQIELDAAGALVYRDFSANGSTVDGQPTQPDRPVVLHSGSVLVLGGDGSDPAECPRVELAWDTDSSELQRTPIRGAMGAAAPNPPSTPLRAPLHEPTPPANTPVIEPGPVQGLLCMLAVRDAQGSRTLAVSRLPYTVGRDAQAHGRIAEANAGVSRIHLEIVAIEPGGLRICNHALEQERRWGIQLEGVEQPGEFSIPWNQTLTLAGRYDKAMPATVTVLAPQR